MRQLYIKLSRFESLEVENPESAARQLYALLFGSLGPVLESERVTTLLIAADRGLQAVPFAALSDGRQYFGERFAFAITPSLALTDFEQKSRSGDRILALGASEFKGLAALPLVPQELNRISLEGKKDKFINHEFTPSSFLDKASEAEYDKVHVATHAEFMPGGPEVSRLHSGSGPISMKELATLREKRKGIPFDLVVLSPQNGTR